MTPGAMHSVQKETGKLTYPRTNADRRGAATCTDDNATPFATALELDCARVKLPDQSDLAIREHNART